MKLQKYEIARAIDKVKSVVQKNEQFKALAGILVKDGWLIGSNTELTVEVKLEACKGEEFIIPMIAFDLIKNLPDGEVEITGNQKNEVTIKTAFITNCYQSLPAEQFTFYKPDVEEKDGLTLPGEKLIDALGHVVFAAADRDANVAMNGVYFDGEEGCLNLVALDGHVIAWDKVEASGTSDMRVIVPKTAIRKLLSMGIIDDVAVSYNSNSIIFKSKEYTIFSRLIDGKYFEYRRLFQETPNFAVATKKELVEAMTRAKMCTTEGKPAVFHLVGNKLKVSISDAVSNYYETVPLATDVQQEIKIGFDSKLVLEAIKAFTCDNITLNFSNPARPMCVQAEDSEMRALVLPVKLKA